MRIPRRLRLLSIILLPILGLPVGLTARADDLRTRCGNSPDPSHFFYCVHEFAGSPNPDVIYFLHGAGNGPETESALLTDANYSGQFKAIRALWRANGVAAPRIIEISYGAIWLLTPRNSAPKSGLLDAFIQRAMPQTEAKLALPRVRRRALWGHSMGGLNAVFLASFAPKLFDRVALNDPAFFGVSPFASPVEMADYARDLGVPAEWVVHLAQICKDYVGAPVDWDRVSLESLAMIAGLARSRVYLSAGTLDRPFFPPARKFEMLARQAGAPVEWRPLAGENHNSADPRSLAAFLVR